MTEPGLIASCSDRFFYKIVFFRAMRKDTNRVDSQFATQDFAAEC